MHHAEKKARLHSVQKSARGLMTSTTRTKQLDCTQYRRARVSCSPPPRGEERSTALSTEEYALVA